MFVIAEKQSVPSKQFIGIRNILRANSLITVLRSYEGSNINLLIYKICENIRNLKN